MVRYFPMAPSLDLSRDPYPLPDSWFCEIFLYPYDPFFSNPKRWCCESAALNMPANLENSAVATGLEKVSFNYNPKEGQ